MESTKNNKQINRLIDHTLLKADATREQIKTLCKEALEYHFFSVCINPFYVSFAKEILKESDVSVCTVIGFPLGANATETKVYETKKAISDGADEIDMVINIGAIKNKEWELVEKDIHEVVLAASPKIVKVIFETCLLSDDEKIKACKIASSNGMTCSFVSASSFLETLSIIICFCDIGSVVTFSINVNCII